MSCVLTGGPRNSAAASHGALVAAGAKRAPFVRLDGKKVLSKCLPKMKRGRSIVSMADGGEGARIAGAAAFVSMADKGAGASRSEGSVCASDRFHNGDTGGQESAVEI